MKLTCTFTLMSGQKRISPLSFPINMGDDQIFEQVFRMYYAQLCDFSAYYVKNADDVEGAIAGIFINLWNRKEVFESESHIRSFLYRSAYNSSLNMIRSNQRQSERENRYSLKTNFTEESYLNNMLRSELIGIIYREIENLPEHYAQVIRMSYKDGFKNEEIAEKLSLSVQTVKNYKTKGLSLLKTRVPREAWIVVSALILSELSKK